MGLALDWYRKEVCEREGHTHGDAGELDCILMRLAQARAAASNAIGGAQPAGLRPAPAIRW